MTEPIWLSIARAFDGLAEVPGLPRSSVHDAGWLCQRALVGPATVHAAEDRLVCHPGATGPALRRVLHALEFKESVLPRVTRLVNAWHPTAVARRIRSIVVVPFDGVTGRGLQAHVGKERAEIISPRVADRDASTAVVGVLRSIRIQASLLHCAPRSVFRALAADLSAMRMHSLHAHDQFAVVAPAGYAQPLTHRGDRRDGCPPAIASAFPVAVCKVSLSHESSVAMARDVGPLYAHAQSIAAVTS